MWRQVSNQHGVLLLLCCASFRRTIVYVFWTVIGDAVESATSTLNAAKARCKPGMFNHKEDAMKDEMQLRQEPDCDIDLMAMLENSATKMKRACMALAKDGDREAMLSATEKVLTAAYQEERFAHHYKVLYALCAAVEAECKIAMAGMTM